MPKWGKILIGVLGILVGLILIFILGFKIWTLTWKTYTNDEFGFSFKYPSTWYISGNIISTKIMQKAGNSLVFWVDSKEKLPTSGQDVVRSLGNVEVWIVKKPTTFLDDQKRQQDFSKFKIIEYGEKMGYTNENVGTGNNASLNGIEKTFFGAEKYFYLDTDNYVFYVDTQSLSANASVLSDTKNYSLFEVLKLRLYHLIGSTILNSFNFYK